MVLIRLIGRIIGTETLVTLIIIVISSATIPSVALDAEVIVPPDRQLTSAGATLKHALRQRYRGWYVVTLHLLDGDVLILVEVLLICLIPSDLARGCQTHEKCNRDKKLLHLFTFLAAKIQIIPELFVILRKIITIYGTTGTKIGYYSLSA
jgi:hypothetical protein